MSHAWFHVQWSTYGTWLPGDPRGFRSRWHRLHSSGDYRRPPPPGEHAGLQQYSRTQLKREPVFLSPELRRRVLASIVEKAAEMDVKVSAIAVMPAHVHLLVRVEATSIGTEVGRFKRSSSHAIRDRISGTVWGARWHDVRVRDRDHAYNVHHYIREHGRLQDGAVWTHLHGFEEYPG